MKQIFESEHIRYVEVSERLIDDYLVMVNDYEHVNRFISGMPRSYTREQEVQWVQSRLAEKASVYSMLEKTSGRFIGNVELMDLTDTEAELGIALTAEMQGRGYGTEAVRAITAYALDHWKLKRLFLRTAPGNARAIRVYEKCGFRAFKRDEHHVYMELLP